MIYPIPPVCDSCIFVFMNDVIDKTVFMNEAPELRTKDAVTSAEWLQSISSDGKKIKGKRNIY